MIYTKGRRSLDINNKSDINDLSSIYAEKTQFNSKIIPIIYDHTNKRRRNSVSSISPISKGEVQPNFFSHTTNLSQTKKYDYSAKMDRVKDDKSYFQQKEINNGCTYKENMSFNQLNRYSKQTQTVSNFLKENEKNKVNRLNNNSYDRTNKQNRVPYKYQEKSHKYENKNKNIQYQSYQYVPDRRVKHLQKQNMSFNAYKQMYPNSQQQKQCKYQNYLHERKSPNYRESKFYAKKSKYSQQVMRKKDNWVSKYDQNQQNKDNSIIKSHTQSQIKQSSENIKTEIIQPQTVIERIQRVEKLNQLVREKLLKMRSKTTRTVK